MRAPRFGIFLLAGRFPGQDDGMALRRARDAVLAAEAAGFDDAWIAEHHFLTYGTCPSAITFAAHALGATTRIAVGTAVSVLPTAHPVALAEQVALLDQLADGRFRLGVGRGGPWIDLTVFGTGLDRYAHGFATDLDQLLAALAGAPLAGAEVAVVPRPRTRPRPPVLVACTSAATVDLAAARGLPMLLGMHLSDAETRALVDRYAATARASGRDPSQIGHVTTVLAEVAASRADAVARLRATLPGWLAEGLAGYVPIDGRPRPRRDPHEYTELLCRLHPVGGPADCVRRIRERLSHTGIRHLIMMVEGCGDHDRTLANIARLGATVLPVLRG